MFELSTINWLAVLVGTVVYFMLGGLWFAPFAFQKLWDKGLGFKRPAVWKPGPKYYVVPLLGCLIVTIATALLLHALKVQSLADALTLGLVTSVGYAAATTGVMAVAPTTPKPGIVAAVVGSYHVAGIVTVSAILFGMK
jgi:hypothetical protein